MAVQQVYTRASIPTGVPPQKAAALRYAKKGHPIFPCKPDKTPHTRHGHKDATTDEARINAWWGNWPEANVGMPTGRASGIISVDLDTYKPDAWTSEDVERELGSLPDTLTVRTGRGGLQKYYRHPAGEPLKGIAENVLGPGVCVKADGGYVLAPPSVTEGPYEWADKHPIAEAPEWLLEALRSKPRAPHGDGEARSAVSIDVAGPPIGEGTRNHTLASIAGRLHDGSRDLGQITADLLAINAERCQPPLPEAEVVKIAASIFRLEPCKPGSGAVEPKVLKTLDVMEAAAHAWERVGMAAFSQWAVYLALLDFARKHGREINGDGDVLVYVDTRSIAWAAGKGHTTARRALKGLETAGRLKRVRSRNKDQAWGYVLLVPESGPAAHDATSDPDPIGSQVAHSNHLEGSGRDCATCDPIPSAAQKGVTSKTEGLYCATFTPIGRSVYGLRWGSGRVGGVGAAVLSQLAKMDDCDVGVSRAALARAMNRNPDSLKKTLKKLVDYGLVERVGRGLYRLVDGFDSALADAREIGGEVKADRLDAAAYARQREAYRLKRQEDERRRRPPAGADGFIEDLERVEDPVSSPPPVEAFASTKEVGAAVADAAVVPSAWPTPEPEGDEWMGHPMSCECVDCSAPVPRYARPYGVAS